MFVSLFACYLLIKPYIHPIILATILSLFVYPLYRQILYLCGSRRSLAAFITSTLLTLLLLPLIWEWSESRDERKRLAAERAESGESSSSDQAR